MAVDYRLDPFQDVLNTVNISGETHTIPSISPFSIRLAEVPLKETPSSISLTIGGYTATEVSSQPAAGEFWPDYSTGADGDENWNTGTILFNASDAGKTVVAAYKGTGMLVDARLGIEIFFESGATTAPIGATKALISGCAGGGGGSVGYNGLGRGGGNGGCVIDYPVLVVGGKSYSVTVGARGTVGINGDWNGVAGGITSFDNLLSLSGGSGGAGANVGGNASDGESFCLTPAGLFGAPGTALTSVGIGNDANGYGCGGGGGYGPSNASRAGGNGSPGFITIKWVA